MTHAAPSFPFFPLGQQTQHYRERRSGCHIRKGYRDYSINLKNAVGDNFKASEYCQMDEIRENIRMNVRLSLLESRSIDLL